MITMLEYIYLTNKGLPPDEWAAVLEKYKDSDILDTNNEGFKAAVMNREQLEHLVLLVIDLYQRYSEESTALFEFGGVDN